MTFTTEACPAGPSLAAAAEQAVASAAEGHEVEIRLTFDPPWTPDKITSDGRALLG
jgi:metal-sulfur cluster biosynthetic enzyme